MTRTKKTKKGKKKFAWVRVDNMRGYEPKEISLEKPADVEWPSEIWWKLPLRDDQP